MTAETTPITPSSGISGTDKPTAEHVVAAYRFFLGREPENLSVVETARASVSDFNALCLKFIGSTEFRKRSALSQGPSHKPLDWPYIAVETDVSPLMLERMMRHIEANWQSLGETEPHFSVLTHPAYRPDKISDNMDMFYESGVKSVSYFQAAAARSGYSLDPNGKCFELGCGVGRVTLPLSTVFSHVFAADISQAHLALASEAASDRGHKNITFSHVQTISDIYSISDFDYFFSIIVLQHNPPPVIKALLQAILSRMRPGGLAYFQVPTYKQGYSFDADEYFDLTASYGRMEVHVIPQHEVFSLAREAGCELLELREDGWTGNPTFISNSFLFTKKLS